MENGKQSYPFHPLLSRLWGPGELGVFDKIPVLITPRLHIATSTEARITISTIHGEHVRHFWQAGGELTTHDLTGLASGTYTVHALFADGTSLGRQLVVID